MAWLTLTSLSAVDVRVLATMFNNVGLDLRTWGGNVDAGGYNLANVAQIHGASNVLKLYTNNAERVQVDSAGKVQVLTALPAQATYEAQWWATSDPGYGLKLRHIWDANGIYQHLVSRFGGTDYKVLSFFAGNVGINKDRANSKFAVGGLPTYASNAAALAASLTAGDFYTDGAGAVKVVY